MIDLELLLDYILNTEEEEWSPEPLYIEDIRPEDVPQRNETFPSPPPNKRVIILDI